MSINALGITNTTYTFHSRGKIRAKLKIIIAANSPFFALKRQSKIFYFSPKYGVERSVASAS